MAPSGIAPLTEPQNKVYLYGTNKEINIMKNQAKRIPELVRRLIQKRRPDEISDWELFKKDWMTLHEASGLINKSERQVRNIINNEKMESKTFVGGQFGKKPTRCVNKSQLLFWFQANNDKIPETAYSHKNSLEPLKSGVVEDIKNNIGELSSRVTKLEQNVGKLDQNIDSISARLADIMDKIASEDIEIKHQKEEIASILPKPKNPKIKSIQTALTVIGIIIVLFTTLYLGTMILSILLDMKK